MTGASRFHTAWYAGASSHMRRCLEEGNISWRLEDIA
jgi:hypothetical protein